MRINPVKIGSAMTAKEKKARKIMSTKKAVLWGIRRANHCIQKEYAGSKYAHNGGDDLFGVGFGAAHVGDQREREQQRRPRRDLMMMTRVRAEETATGRCVCACATMQRESVQK